MTKTEALYRFFNSFEIEAFPNFAPSGTEFPYMIYDTTLGEIGSTVSIALNIYYHTDSEALPNAKVEQISDAIGLGGKIIHHDDGAIWIQRGNPLSVSSVGEDTSIKHRQMNLNLLFI